MSGDDVTYGVAPANPRAGIVVCDDLGSARDLAELLTGAAVMVSRDSGQTWEEVPNGSV
jgi:hypothetical protein